MFVPDGQSDRSRPPERICAGQTDKGGQATVQDRFSLSGIDTWPDWIQAAAAVITAIGLVTAGIWALVRFKRGRTFMERCSIDLSLGLSSGISPASPFELKSASDLEE